MDERLLELQEQVDVAALALGRIQSGLKELLRLGPGGKGIVERQGAAPPFSFRWPDGVERYAKAGAWRIRDARGVIEVTVGRARRSAWGRTRQRAVVFGPTSRGVSTRYPWCEFVETDDGRMSAVVPVPEHPRRILRAGDALPPRYLGKTVMRADELFGSISSGASLRLVVEAEQEDEMVRHAHYVAQLKGRV